MKQSQTQLACIIAAMVAFFFILWIAIEVVHNRNHKTGVDPNLFSHQVYRGL